MLWSIIYAIIYLWSMLCYVQYRSTSILFLLFVNRGLNVQNNANNRKFYFSFKLHWLVNCRRARKLSLSSGYIYIVRNSSYLRSLSSTSGGLPNLPKTRLLRWALRTMPCGDLQWKTADATGKRSLECDNFSYRTLFSIVFCTYNLKVLILHYEELAHAPEYCCFN